MRIERKQYYIQIAKAVSEKSDCFVKIGIVAVKDKAIIATAYNTKDMCATLNLICQCVKKGTVLQNTTIYTNAYHVHADCSKYLKEIEAKLILRKNEA